MDERELCSDHGGFRRTGGGARVNGYLAVPGEIIQRARSLGIHLDNWSMREFTRKREGVLRSGQLALEDTEMMLAALEQVRDQLAREFAQAGGR